MTYPEIIDAIAGYAPARLSQFTLDWIERTVSDYQDMRGAGELPPDNELIGGLRYEAKNILDILAPDRARDVEFFYRVLGWCGRE